MDNTDKIVREISRKNKEIETKKAEISRLQDEIRDLQIFIEGMEQSLKLLNKSIAPSKPFTLRVGSEIDKVRTLLLKSAEPLHINFILKSLGKDENDNKAKLSLAGSLGSYVREGKIFTKPAPNTFGLLEKQYFEELGEEEEEEEDDGLGDLV
jgi:hypothetical protein